LRQSPCANFEANFLYLLVGSDKALLIDTGAVADPKAMPLAKTILELLPDKDQKKLPLLVAHTHRHLDHRAGDPLVICTREDERFYAGVSSRPFHSADFAK
jgi:hydroxyacylglutathione hydrolase